jgi:hypothetical protein
MRQRTILIEHSTLHSFLRRHTATEIVELQFIHSHARFKRHVSPIAHINLHFLPNKKLDGYLRSAVAPLGASTSALGL